MSEFLFDTNSLQSETSKLDEQSQGPQLQPPQPQLQLQLQLQQQQQSLETNEPLDETPISKTIAADEIQELIVSFNSQIIDEHLSSLSCCGVDSSTIEIIQSLNQKLDVEKQIIALQNLTKSLETGTKFLLTIIIPLISFYSSFHFFHCASLFPSLKELSHLPLSSLYNFVGNFWDL